jgi:hypothetical protein
VLAFLDRANLWRQDLTEIAWRMKDKAYFQKVTGLLEARHIYNDTLWVIGGRGAGLTYSNDVWATTDGTNWYCSVHDTTA